MELRGIPCVTVTSTVFRLLAEREAAAFNLPDLPVLDVPHPIGTHSIEELERLGRGLVDQISASLTERTGQ